MPKPFDPPRKDPSREPPTIDLKARLVDDGAPGEPEPEPALSGRPAEPSELSEAEAAAPIAADTTAATNEGPTPGTVGNPALSSSRDADTVAETAPAADDAKAETVDPTAPIPSEDMARLQRSAGSSVPPISGPRPQPGAERRRAPGFGAMAGAGLLGGLVGAGLVYGLQAWRAGEARLDPRIAGIEQRLAAVPRTDAIEGVERRIAAIEAAQGDLARGVDEARTLAERAASRAEEAASRPGAQAAPADPATPAPSLPPDLTERIANLEAALRAATPPSDLAGRLQALEAESRERAQGMASSLQAVETRLTETGQAVDRRLADANARLERRVDGAGEALDRRLAELSQNVERRFAEGAERISALDRKLSEWNAEALRAGFRVVLAGRLNEALAQGAPFADVLGGLKRFDIPPERLQALEPLAASGAPNAAALARAFEPVSERILRESRGEAAGIGDRFLRMAEKVVSIRPVDDPGSTEVPALVARIEDALARGALADAAAAWDALPAPARQVSEAFGQRLRARVAAENAARGIASDAVAALNAAPR